MVIIYSVWILLSIFVGFAGRQRALGFWGFFLASLFVSPLLMLLVLLVTQPRTELDRSRRHAVTSKDRPPQDSTP